MEDSNTLKKLVAIATDLTISGELRSRAVMQLGRMGTHEALLALLEMVASEALSCEERLRTLKQAERILRAGQKSWWSFKPRRRDN